MLKAPFPFFGGKSAVAKLVWQAIGADVPNYVEPFCGSAAILLARPGRKFGTETINDLNSYICNVWRAIKHDPGEVAKWADYPVSECDLHARHRWLVERGPDLSAWLEEEPDNYDAKIAGWWVWGQCTWLGTGWCDAGVRAGAGDRGERDELRLRKGCPSLGNDGTGINSPSLSRKRPHVADGGIGVHQLALHRKRPHLADGGKGINRVGLTDSMPQLIDSEWAGSQEIRRRAIEDYMRALCDRLRHVRILCGDWSRAVTHCVTTAHGVTGIFLDPPYSGESGRELNIYSADDAAIAHQVRDWCLSNGGNFDLHIVLCGLDGEGHEELEQHGWKVVRWKAHGGYNNQGPRRANRFRERLWLSPGCLGGYQPQLLEV